jgi:hypothetical protein
LEVIGLLKSAFLITYWSCQLSGLSAVKAQDADVVEAVVIEEAADELFKTLAELILEPSLEH